MPQSRPHASPALSKLAPQRRWRLRIWGPILGQAARDFLRGDGFVWAGSLAFFTLLSLFPLVIAAVILSSYFTDPRWVTDRLVTGVNEFIPSSQIDASALLDGAMRERARLGVAAIVVVVLTGRRVLGTLVLAFDRMSDVDQRNDPFRRRVLVELALILGLAVLAALALLTRPALALVERAVGVEPDGARWGVVALETVQALLILGTFVVVYAVVPLGVRDWRAVTIAAGITTALFLLIRSLFTIVVDQLWETLSTLYGPFASAAYLLTWLYWVAALTLFGAALASHIKVMAIEGATIDETTRRHVPRVDGIDTE